MRFIVTWCMLAALWLGLSGHYDAIHLVFGFLSVTLVAALSSRHLTGGGSIGLGLRRLGRTALHVPWLLWQMLVANVDVLLRVFGLRPLDPSVICVRPGVTSDYGRALLANSITLTPGTVTIEISDEVLLVHAIGPQPAETILSGAMQQRARRVEGDT